MSDETVSVEVTEKKARKRYGVTKERFLEVWKNAKNLDEVVATLGMSRAVACARASNYRKQQGLELKRMPKATKNAIDVAAVNNALEAAA